MKKLRSTLIADGIDEERKEDALDAAVDGDAKLADQHPDKQCTGDAAKDEAANFKLSDKVAEGNRQKERQQRLPGDEIVDKLHVWIPSRLAQLRDQRCRTRTSTRILRKAMPPLMPDGSVGIPIELASETTLSMPVGLRWRDITGVATAS